MKHTARSRWRARRGERGATMFIVTLVMALLAGMGVVASRASGLAELAVGYDRMGEQTHYLMHHGVNLALAEIASSPNAYNDNSSNGLMNQNPSCSAGQFANAALLANPSTAALGVKYKCVKFTTDSLTGLVQQKQQQAGALIVPPITPAVSPSGTLTDASVNTPGSLGPMLLNPKVYIEYTDTVRSSRPVAGSSVGNTGLKCDFLQATFSAWAQIGPLTNLNGTCDATEQNAALLTNRETGRAYLTLGPICN